VLRTHRSYSATWQVAPPARIFDAHNVTTPDPSTSSRPPAAQPALQRPASIAGGVLLIAAFCAGFFLGGETVRVVATHLASALLGIVAWIVLRTNASVDATANSLESARSAASREDKVDDEQRRTLERLELATKAAGIGIWDWDLVTNRLASDANMANVFRQSDKHAFPDARDFIKNIIHPDDLEQFQRTLAYAIQHSDSVEHSYRTVEPDGSPHHARLTGKVFRNEAGAPVRFLCVTVETTKLVEAAAKVELQTKELQEMVERFNLATNAAGISVWEYDIRQRMLVTESRRFLADKMNDRVSSQFFLDEVVVAEDKEEFKQVMQRALRDGDSVSHRYRARTSAGEVIYLQMHGRIFRDEAGRASRLLGVTSNVSAQERASAEIQRQAEQQKELLERLNLATQVGGLGVWDWNITDDRLVMDEAVARGYGIDHYTVDRDARAFFTAVVHREDLAVFNEGLDAALATGDSMSLRHRVVTAAGQFHVQINAHIFRDAQGKATRMLGVTTNVTAEVRRTGLLQRQADDERALRDRLDLATRTAGIGVWDMDLVTRKINADDQVLKLLGVQGELDEPRLLASIYADDRDAVTATLERMIADASQDEIVSLRHRMADGEGEIRFIQTHIRLFRDESGCATSMLGVTWSVNEEVEHAQQLKQNAERVQTLLDRFGVAIKTAGISPWEIDARTFKFRWAENRQKLIDPNLSAEEYGLALSKLMHPHDREEMRAIVRAAIASGEQSYSARYRLVRPDGLVRHMQSYAHIFRDANGEATRLLGATTDITNEVQTNELLQRQAEHERVLALQLRDAERRLERASLSSSEGHWELDMTNGQIWLSSSYHALLGYAEGELPTLQEFQKLEHPDDAARLRAVFDRHIDHGDPYDIEVRLQTAADGYRWFRRRGTAERDANGRPVRMSGSIHDIHQQKLAEDALKLAQRRFERAINGTQDGLWELEAGGVAWCSPRLGELLGFGPDEFASDTHFLRMFLHPDDANAVALATQAHFQQEQPYDVEIRLRTKSGEYRWYRARATAERDSTGRPLRLSGSLQDVSEARAARDELMRATQAAEAANSAKSEFLANVSHEIRTPMNGIIGMTGLLMDTALDRTQRDYAETIRGSADSLLIVINDILDFSKIEAGKLDIEAIELDLRSNVEDVGSTLAFQAAAKNLELVVHVHPEVPDRVIGDPQRVRQCLINLVGNAVKFTRSGEIVIEVRCVGRRDGKVLTQFEVRDTGIGIAQSTLQTLFQPFVQADSSTTRHFGGTGLGLSIVRRLVEMMGGQVGVESEVGKGSTFWFMLPLHPAEESSLHPPVNLTRLGRRILVVDDNETNRRVLAGQLMHASFEVSLASSGDEAMQMLRQAASVEQPFEVVLADYELHDIGGEALGEAINSDPQLSKARVVLLTSLDRHGDIKRFASMGFAGYLTKPIRARELFECMDRVLSRDSKEWHMQSQPIVTKGMLISRDSGKRYSGSVLLVEDNPVNQKVAVRFLERMGCRVRVADNGAEGVRAYQEMAFDIVLMDLQMPVMDGLTATRRIREIETGGRATPIVALTANAMAGQLERCMEAGMTDFLTKPLDIGRLHETLERFGLRADSATETGADASSSGVGGVPVDLGRLHEVTEGDAAFAYELAQTFVSSGAQVMQEVRDAMGAFDRPALGRAAHKLKGASSNVHAVVLRDLSHTLETQAGAMDQPRLKELIEQLEEEFTRAAQFLQQQAPEPTAQTG
jgi:two-component system sensor histidine kinase/response regulator